MHHMAIIIVAVAGTTATAQTIKTFADQDENGDAVTLGSGHTATVEPAGIRPPPSGARFFNIQGPANGAFASWGPIRWNLDKAYATLDQAAIDAGLGPGDWQITGATMSLTQANANFTTNGDVEILYSQDDITNIDPYTAPPASLTFPYTGQLDPTTVVALLSFVEGPDGTVDMVDISDPSVLADLNDQLDTHLTIVIIPIFSDVAATYKGQDSPFMGLNAPCLELSYVLVPDEPVIAFGLPNFALGQAELNVDVLGGHLFLSNIGASGDDGVRVEANETLGIHVVSAADQFPQGAETVRKTFVRTADDEIVHASTLQIEHTDAGVILTPDFSGIGAGTFSARLYLDHVLVDEASGLSGMGAWVPDAGAFALLGECCHVEDGEHWYSENICPSWSALPGGPLVEANLMIFEPDDPQIVAVATHAIEVTSKLIDSMTVFGEWVILFADEIPHLALGNARFLAQDKDLHVSELQDVETDGVRFDFIELILPVPPLGDFRASLNGVEFDGTGDSLVLSAVGEVNGDQDVPLGTATLFNVGTFIEVFADFESLGSKNVGVEMYKDGMFVGGLTVPGGGFVGTLAPIDNQPITSTGVGKLSGGPVDPPCIWLAFENDVVFQSGPLIGDELRLLAADAPFPVDKLQRFDLMTNVGELTVTNAEFDACLADCNGDGAINILDFVCFQGNWQAQTPQGDCDGNGVYNILDFVCFQALFVQGCP